MSNQPELLRRVENVEKSVLPIWSMILGILSVLGCTIFAAIPAVICGHKALWKIKTSGGTMPGYGQAVAGLVTGYIALAFFALSLLILPGLLLPPLAKVKNKAVSIGCVSNLKQVGLAARLWSGDNGDHYPWSVSTTNHGTLELCNRDQSGIEINPAPHFQVMSNELSNPKILICTGDTTKTRALNFTDLAADNVSFALCTGKDVDETNPQAVMAYCPIHGNVLFADGSVAEMSNRAFKSFLEKIKTGQNPTEAYHAASR